MLADTNLPFGQYRLTSLLGRGGMAEVWRGLLLGPDGRATELAVKRILPHLCDELPVVEMFLSEARIAMRLLHANLVRTYNVGLVKGQPYIAMELLDGADLGKLARDPAGLPIGFVLAVVRDVCGALAYVHSLGDDHGRPLGLIHRDITPSNVMVQRDGTVKLLDFGIAKAAQAGGMPRTDIGQLKGKLGYLAPEMIHQGRYDQRADLFAVGVVLWELLVQRRLFEATDEGVRLWLNARCDVPAPSTLRRAIRPALDALVLRAVARDPDARYQDAATLARDLEALLAAEPWSRADSVALMRERAPRSSATAAAATPSSQLRRRRRWPVVSAGVALAVMLAALSLAWGLLRPHASPPSSGAAMSQAVASPARLEGSIVSAAGDAWAHAGALDAVASSEVMLTATPPQPRPPHLMVTVEQPTIVQPVKTIKRNAHHAASAKTHRRGGGDELDKVIEQKGLIDVYSSAGR
jgi:hypothetical protein